MRVCGRSVAEVVDSHVLEAGLLADDLPRRVEIAQAPAGPAPRNDPGVTGGAGQPDKNLPDGRRHPGGRELPLSEAHARAP